MKYYNKLLITTVTVCLIFGLAGAALAADLTDITNHWANNQIKSWVEQGLASGYPDGTFKPDKEISRAEFVVLVNKAFNINSSNETNVFNDVKANDWFSKDVAAARAAAYIAGYEDNTFKPDQKISRQEVAAIVTRLLKLDTAGDLTELDKFTDSKSIPSWSQAGLNAVVKKGIIKGYPDQTVQPFKAITRAEAIVCLSAAKGEEKTPPVVTVKPAIEGKVTYKGSAVKGAAIKLFNKDGYQVIKKTTTDAQGAYKLEADPGVYDLTATTDKTVAYASDVTVAADTITSNELVLEDAAIVTGKLNDKNNKAAANIEIMFTTNPTFVATTDQNGEYTLVLLSGRKYTIRAINPNNHTAEVIRENVDIGSSAQKQTMSSLSVSFATASSGGGGGGGGGGSTGSDDYPSISSASITIKDADQTKTFTVGSITDGKGTIVLTGSENALITGGSITVSEASKLTVTSPAFLASLQGPQQLTAGTNNLDTIDLLTNASATLGLLHDAVSDGDVTLAGKLTDNDGNTSNVQLKIVINLN
ncbi:S-layer domain protein [Desulfofarcimen acetoxidans DSM 771]|jgi:hypothetical protein|uniref:S-layer domain protein n=1 Tax=Desulfofarcimen acetoxidans (strain ATCC 49208 / DSM 771 / KCTC 5769 / VKM B-1644 / 5575) TaxID=485916 RepID=C8VY49_DESAS|nr:S-layer homology domain-containing protein [Desulfofarcimen acetoxidans]ACV64678.1 S-layer domain protein [Desulfofarcimen acetoxidans DSM 771]